MILARPLLAVLLAISHDKTATSLAISHDKTERPIGHLAFEFTVDGRFVYCDYSGWAQIFPSTALRSQPLTHPPNRSPVQFFYPATATAPELESNAEAIVDKLGLGTTQHGAGCETRSCMVALVLKNLQERASRFAAPDTLDAILEFEGLDRRQRSLFHDIVRYVPGPM